MTMQYELQELNYLIAALEKEAAGEEFDADQATDLAFQLMQRFPEISASMQSIIDRLSARKLIAA